MERVTGIGGLFFRARDPAALARWYADHLGIDPVPATDEQRPWWQQPGRGSAGLPPRSCADSRPAVAWSRRWRERVTDHETWRVLYVVACGGLALGAKPDPGSGMSKTARRSFFQRSFSDPPGLLVTVRQVGPSISVAA